MKDTHAILSLRYAKAFMRTFGAQITEDQIDAFSAFSKFFVGRPELVFFFNLTLIPLEKRKDQLQTLAQRYNLMTCFTNLCLLLIDQQRFSLLGTIAHLVEKFYQKHHNVRFFKVTSALELTDHEQTTIQHFLEQNIEGTIRCTYSQDKKLIAGLKVTSGNLLWENSMREKIKNITFLLQRRSIV